MTGMALSIPNDLQPLPTQPWEERPTDVPLVLEEVRTALWLNRGNVTKAAETLKVTSLRLRTFVDKSVRLTREVKEAREQLADIAEDIVYEALTDRQDATRRDAMARFVLKSNNATTRGYRSAGTGVGVSIPGGKGTITISWANGDAVTGEQPTEAQSQTIEGNFEDVSADDEDE